MAKIDAFTLPDTYARARSLAEFKDKPIVVVAFFGTECPLARLYAPRLQELSDQYAAKGVAFYGVDSNWHDTPTKLAHYAKTHQIEFPLPTGITAVVDPKQTRVTVSGIDRQKVGQVAADMRSLRKPDPYKNKGVRYADEKLKKKVGKTGAK